MFIPRSLKARLALGLVAVAVLPMVITGWFAAGRLSRDMESDIQSRNLVLAQSIAGELERFVEAPRQVLQLIQSAHDTGRFGDAAMDGILEQHARFHPYFLSLFVLDTNGIVRHHHPFDKDYDRIDMSTQEFFRAARGGTGPYWSPVSISMETGQPSSTMVLAGEKNILVAYLDLASLSGVIDRVRIGAGGYVAIVDQQGSVIAHQNKKAVQEQWNFRNHPAVALALEGRDTSYRRQGVSDGELESAARAPHTGWVVVVSQKAREAFAPVRTLRFTVTASIILAILLGVAIAVLMLNRELAPLARLTAGTRQVAGGDFAVRLPAPDPGDSTEIAELTTTFNTMLDAVRARQQALIESEERFAKAFRCSPDAIAITTLSEGRVIDANEGFERLLGHTLRESVSRTVLDLDIWAVAEERTAFVQQLQVQGRVRNRKCSFQTKGGSRLDCLISAEMIDLGGERCIVSIIRDVTDQNRLEEQLRQSQKMEAVGTLAGGIAHDFNNILYAIIGYTELALSRSTDAVQKTHLQAVETASSRATELVKQILAFSRMSRQEAKPIQPITIVKEALKLLRASIPTTIEIRTRVLSNAVVMADPGEIHRIVVNLCTNAALAMQEAGGVLDVELTDTELDAMFTSSHPEVKPGRFVCLSVKDTGCGMTEEVKSRIFEPFFTTRGEGLGTGLGLSVVHGIVRSRGGTISVASAPGSGTTFKVFLPAVGQEAEAETDILDLPAPGTERILFVDDEAMVASLAQEALGGFGYRVTCFTSSADALARFKAGPHDFDLVVTDMTMPGLTGDQLAVAIHAIRPDLPVILCTGFSEKITSERAGELGIDAFVLKPVSARALSQIIRRTLEQSSSRAADRLP